MVLICPARSCICRCRSPCTPVLSDKPGILVRRNICRIFYFNLSIAARHREIADNRIDIAQLRFKCFSVPICYLDVVYYIFCIKVLKFQIYLRTRPSPECDWGIRCSFTRFHQVCTRSTFRILFAPVYFDLGIWRISSIFTNNIDCMLTIIYSDLAVRLFAFVKLADCSNCIGTSRSIFVNRHRSIICHMNRCQITADPFYIS